MCIKNDAFFANVVEWNDKTIVLEYRDTHTQTRVLLEDANGFAQLLGRKRKNVWVALDDGTLTDVQWIRKSGRGVTLRYFSQANRWFNYI